MNGRKYKFHRVVIIESLEDHEVKTGLENGKLLSGEIERINKNTPVDYYRCERAIDFKKMIGDLINQTSPNNVPLLHIECHGDAEEGLEFSNGSVISWSELSAILFPLNIASNCNLMLCISACHAASFLNQMGNFKLPCPCRILVAPATAVDPGECMRGFRVFYSSLFDSMRVDMALDAIENLKSSEVIWLGEYAEKWFENVATHVISKNYSKSGIKENALRIHQELKKNGIQSNIGDVKFDIQRYMREFGVRSIYEKFFGIDEYPEVDAIYTDVFLDFSNWIKGMREAGHLGF